MRPHGGKQITRSRQKLENLRVNMLNILVSNVSSDDLAFANTVMVDFGYFWMQIIVYVDSIITEVCF